LFKKFLNAYKVPDVTDLIMQIKETARPSWKPVGDRENNLATINLGSDPAAGLVERITNAIDAVLEKKWLESNEPTNLLSPRSAVDMWFGIKDGILKNVENIRDFSDLSHQVIVTLFDSGVVERPTIDIRDFGIGILSEHYGSTILSLNASRKLRKFFLSGAFGQGGSTALTYSPYTLILSRAVSIDKNTINPVAATIVRYNPGDPKLDKHGVYEYMVDNATGHPFTFDISEAEFPCGTLVRHVSMDLGKYKNIMTAPTSSLWFLAHHYLFDPVIPFWIQEERPNASKGEGRTVAGNHRRLSISETEYYREATLTFRSGSVKINWWVLSGVGDNSKEQIRNYCLPSRPIIITYNGQKQGDLPNTIIKNDLKLPYLDRYLIVHVDCDKLDSESRRQLFPTTRESLRDTSLLDDLRILVTETLEGDDELKRLDKERKQRFMQRVEGDAVENIRKRLAKRVSAFIKSAGQGTTPTRRTSGGGGEHHEKPAIPVQDPPTFLEITSPNPRNVYSGSNFVLHFRTDANPNLFCNPDEFMAIITPPSFGHYTGTTSIRNGYGVAYFSAKEELEEDTTADISIELRPRRSKALSSSIKVKVVPRPEISGEEGGQNNKPNINPQWVLKGEEFWKENNWNEYSVAKVIENDDEIIIFVSADNIKLNSLIQKAQRRGTSQVDAIKNFYLEHLSFYAYLAYLNRQQVDNILEGIAEQNTEEESLADKMERMELVAACETVIGVITQMFEVLLAEQEAAAVSE